jgi:3-oxoacyl-[acyl-carrier-protein] synthase-1
MGVVSSIGTGVAEVLGSLRTGRSGIAHQPEYEEMGLRSQVEGSISIDLDAVIDRKLKRFMGGAAAYNYLAVQQAIQDAGLSDSEISDPRVGLICGSGGGSPENIVLAADTLRNRGVRRVGPYMVTRAMSSTIPACLATAFKIKGMSYTISSACATSAHCIGHASELIQLGKQDMVFAGGGEEIHWTMTVLFDGMGALSSGYNHEPHRASRAYDAHRDGFVISGGGGVLVMEELEHARRRGAKIYAELVGYGATSDGFDMVQPSGEGAARCMQQAMEGLDEDIGYINAHGTSTPLGDLKELEALREVFGDKVPPVSSTKSLTGHALGAAGVCEAIYSLLMLEHGFIAASANIETIDPSASDFPIARETVDAELRTVMTNSFGFGGTNSTLIFRKFD